MHANLDKPHRWKADVDASVDFYNAWFIRFAPETFRGQRAAQAGLAASMMEATAGLRDLTPERLLGAPGLLAVLRMATAPPIARDRLSGLAYARRSTVDRLEAAPSERRKALPVTPEVRDETARIVGVIEHMLDRDLFPWLATDAAPDEEAMARAALVVADRLCGAASDPIVRNAQEMRQLTALRTWLEAHGYRFAPASDVEAPASMEPGTFSFRLNVPVRQGDRRVNLPVDAVVQPHRAVPGALPLLVEAKSAGDFANTNKRRKEEAQKMTQLRATYGPDVRFVLLLCGYFGPDYLGYEASEGIDWVWEHRLDDLSSLGLDPGAGGGYGGGATAPAPVRDPDAPAYGEAAPLVTAGHDEAERRRLAFQRMLDEANSHEDRNRMGQFATPPVLARAMLRHARTFSPEVPVRFLDPSIGTGSFYSALLATFAPDEIASARGVELDEAFGDAASTLWAETGLVVTPGDFTVTEPPPPGERATLVVANPPYARHHHLEASEKRRLAEQSAQVAGVAPSGLSGLHAYFLYLCHAWMAPGALAGWLIPSEFMTVGYGREMRRYLSERVTLLHVHRFDAADVQFTDALVSSAVVWFRNAPPPPGHAARFTDGGPLDAPRSSQTVTVERLRAAPKWPPRAAVAIGATGDGAGGDGAPALTVGDLFTIRRGMATGGNDFFVMAEAEARAREIPPAFLRPVLPSPRYLRDVVIGRTADGGADIERRNVLLVCALPEVEVERDHPALWAYLQQGVADGVSARYLCRSRTPWYAQERREPAPFLSSYMGRGDAEPFRFFWNRSDALATNVYLNLYPRPALARALRERPEVAADLWAALRRVTGAQLVAEGRTYGGGLHKLEPKELAAAPLSGLEGLAAPTPTLFG